MCFYRSPSSDFNIFMDYLEKIFDLKDISKYIIVCDDFNVKFNTNDDNNAY